MFHRKEARKFTPIVCWQDRNPTTVPMVARDGASPEQPEMGNAHSTSREDPIYISSESPEQSKVENAPSTTREDPIYISSDSESFESLKARRNYASQPHVHIKESPRDAVTESNTALGQTSCYGSHEHATSVADNQSRTSVEEPGRSHSQPSATNKSAHAFDPADVHNSDSPRKDSTNIKSAQRNEYQAIHQVGNKKATTGLQGVPMVVGTTREEDGPEVTLPDLRNLQLAIGRERVPFLPKFPELRLDEVTDEDEYLPIAVLIGTYVPSGIHSTLRGLEIWAYHMIQGEDIFPDIKPHAPLELVAFAKKGDHISDLEGIGLEDTWLEVKEHVQFLPGFAHLRSTVELLCLVRYCLLLAANAQLFGFDGSTVPKDMGFTRKLVDICHRRWDEQRFKTYEETGVLPEYHEIWKHASRGRIPQREEVEMFSESEESSGEDEIPDLPPKPYKKLSKRRRG